MVDDDASVLRAMADLVRIAERLGPEGPADAIEATWTGPRPFALKPFQTIRRLRPSNP